ncbi:hypothetical protein [Vibrio casei]|uniref:hypothetical protein n=1 Tax=Vibrio casei TaxID=673372 RepID=UPI003F969640
MRVSFKAQRQVVDALRICYENSKPYSHGGEIYRIKSLSIIGSGRDARLIADMELFI